jgi:hypothetical protein
LNDEQMELLATVFQRRYEPNFAVSNAISMFLSLPAIRGFMPASAHYLDAAPIIYLRNFVSPTAAHSFTPGGSAVYAVSGLAPYVSYSAFGIHTSVDAPHWDIIGTETYIASPGLTFGGWFRFDNAPANFETVMAKSAGAGNNSWYMARNNAGNVRGDIYDALGANFTVLSTETVAASVWKFLVTRFTPNTELALFVSENKYTNVAAIPASLFNSAASVSIANRTGAIAEWFTGRASMMFICACALSDTQIAVLRQQTRAMFGV